MAESKLLQQDLAQFSASVNRSLDQERGELTALAESKTVQRYMAGAMTSVANNRQAQEFPASLKAVLTSVLNNKSAFNRLIFYGRDRRPVFVAERNRDSRTVDELSIRTSNFFPAMAQPHEQVWKSRGTEVWNSSVTTSPFGATQAHTAPVFVEGGATGSPQAALVGELNIDSILTQSARLVEEKNQGDVEALLIVLDRAGRVLYHPNNAVRHQTLETALPSFVPVFKLMFTNQQGTSQFSLSNGQEYLAAFMPLARLDAGVAVSYNQSQALLASKRAGLLGILVSLAIGVLTAIVLTQIWQRQYRGYDRVTEGVTAIVKGELERRIDVKSGDEARVIADNINLMTQRLREQLAREAEARQFESFVRLSAMLTHDLKNAIEALSLIVGNMELHFDNERFRADTMKSLTIATEKLKGLVARISNPVTTLSGEHKRPLPFDLGALLRRVSGIIIDPVNSKYQVELKIGGPVYALADADRIEKVVENLLINALDAMRDGGKLTIESGTAGPGSVFFSISDTGSGMSGEFINQRLFRPFSTTKKMGVGLGLYTCREVVRANGGSIEAQSKMGVGTTFRVVLPSSSIERRK